MTKRRLGDCLQALPLFRHHYLVTIIRHYLSSLSRRLRELRRPPGWSSSAGSEMDISSRLVSFHRRTGAPFRLATLFWASKRKSQSPATGLYANEVSNKYGGRHAKPFTKSLRLPNIDFDRRQGSQKQLLGFQFLSSNQLALGHAAPLETSTHPLVGIVQWKFPVFIPPY